MNALLAWLVWYLILAALLVATVFLVIVYLVGPAIDHTWQVGP